MDGDSLMVFMMKLLSLAPVSVAKSSSLGRVSCFNGATLVLAITKQVLESLQMKATAPYAFVLVSENT